MEEMDQVIQVFPQKLRRMLQQAKTADFQAEELRLRAGQPFLMQARGREWFLMEDGRCWVDVGEMKAWRQPHCFYLATSEDIHNTLELMSRYSLYAFDRELRQGFLTIPGGHRIGVAGQAVLEGNQVKTLQNISFLNVRIARQIPGCESHILPWVYEKGRLCSLLIISPPGCGKTTLLRDLIRQVSNGWEYQNHLDQRPLVTVKGIAVGVVDERSELGACSYGIPQNDLGIRTDVLDGCPKAEGIMMLIRSMAPRVVAVDEIGSKEDLEAIRYGKNCGCKLMATVHGSSLEDIQKKPVLKEFVQEGVFERFIVLEAGGKPGTVKLISDGEGQCMKAWKGMRE